MDYNNPNGIVSTEQIPEGMVRWKSPSNIALIKYWGKHGNQLPRNPSISFTLEAAFTETSIQYRARREYGSGLEFSFYFEGEENPAFGERIGRYLNALLPIFPFLKQLSLEIRSGNSFPHSSGIASSASSMSALALCLCTMEERLLGVELDNEAFDRKVSYVARLGSGSAARSVFPKMALWGKLNEVAASSDEFAIGMAARLHERFHDFRDWILIVSREVKSVSSTAGHDMMNNHDFAEARYAQARRKTHFLMEHLSHGQIVEAGKVIEEEALTLHGLMMCSMPGYVLMEPETLQIIRAIREFREKSGVQVFFTLDAGPNVHMLYSGSDEKAVEDFIKTRFPQYMEPERSIRDKLGAGPVQLD